MSFWDDLIEFLNPLDGGGVRDRPRDPAPEVPAEEPIPVLEEPPQVIVPREVWRKTLNGRVVYNRKRHFFKLRDVERILRKIIDYEEGQRATPEQVLADARRILELLQRLILVYGNPDLDAAIGRLVQELFERFFKAPI